MVQFCNACLRAPETATRARASRAPRQAARFPRRIAAAPRRRAGDPLPVASRVAGAFGEIPCSGLTDKLDLGPDK